MEKFNVVDDECIELCIGDSVEVLSREKGEGWVIEQKLMTVMQLMDDRKGVQRYKSLIELESKRPDWSGIVLSMFDECSAVTH
jgi:hypothetical protein